jgi:tricorn protease-like protein
LNFIIMADRMNIFHKHIKFECLVLIAIIGLGLSMPAFSDEFVIQYKSSKHIPLSLADIGIKGNKAAPKRIVQPKIKIARATSVPRIVFPGGEITLTTKYLLRLPADIASTAVSETWTLKKNGVILASLSNVFEREAGAWIVDGTIPVPFSATAGTYIVQHIMEAAPYSRAMAQSRFSVKIRRKPNDIHVGFAKPAAAEERIAFVREQDGKAEIYATSAEGGKPSKLSQEAGEDEMPAWSPTQSQMAFVSNRMGHRDIYIMNADGSNQHKLSHSDSDEAWPSWSPLGDKILFLSDRNSASHFFQLYSMNPDGSDSVLLSPNYVAHASWHPNGQSIVFSDIFGELWVLDLVTQQQIRLTEDNWHDDYPSWSPDGNYIVFASDRISQDADRLDIFIMNISDKAIKKILGGKSSDERYPSCLPDGRMVFSKASQFGAQDSEIYITLDSIVNAPVRWSKRLTHNQAVDSQPVVRPVGLEATQPSMDGFK